MSEEKNTTQYLGAYEVENLETKDGRTTVTLKDYDGGEYVAHEKMVAKMLSDQPNPTAQSLNDLKIALVAMEIEDLLVQDEYDFTIQDVKTLCHYLEIGMENNYKEAVSRMFEVKNPQLIPIASIRVIIESLR